MMLNFIAESDSENSLQSYRQENSGTFLTLQ